MNDKSNSIKKICSIFFKKKSQKDKFGCQRNDELNKERA